MLWFFSYMHVMMAFLMFCTGVKTWKDTSSSLYRVSKTSLESAYRVVKNNGIYHDRRARIGAHHTRVLRTKKWYVRSSYSRIRDLLVTAKHILAELFAHFVEADVSACSRKCVPDFSSIHVLTTSFEFPICRRKKTPFFCEGTFRLKWGQFFGNADA